MTEDFRKFETIVRRWTPESTTDKELQDQPENHPFDARNIHPDFPPKIKRLFDDGYFSEASLEAFKWLDKEVRRLSGSRKWGYQMMMDVFNEINGAIALTPRVEQTEIDEQIGYKFIFAGSQSAIRNPRAHETDIDDSLDKCLDHLALASLLLRRLDEAGLRK